jgi:hypothetical protein
MGKPLAVVDGVEVLPADDPAPVMNGAAGPSVPAPRPEPSRTVPRKAKKPRAKPKKRSRALAVRQPEVHTPNEDRSRLYVPLPLPPEVVTAAREHYTTGMKLWEMFGNLQEVNPTELAEALESAAAAIARDVKRIRVARARARASRAKRR